MLSILDYIMHYFVAATTTKDNQRVIVTKEGVFQRKSLCVISACLPPAPRGAHFLVFQCALYKWVACSVSEIQRHLELASGITLAAMDRNLQENFQANKILPDNAHLAKVESQNCHQKATVPHVICCHMTHESVHAENWRDRVAAGEICVKENEKRMADAASLPSVLHRMSMVENRLAV